MKKIGIIGGLGPESTVDYYKGIIHAFHPTYDQTGYPEITIESCNLKELLSYSSSNRWDKIAQILAGKVKLLIQAGCDFGAIASNTPHKVFHEIQLQSDLPLLSIVDATCRHAIDQNLKRLCLLGTGFTMRSDFYQKTFSKNGIELFVPDPDEIDYLHDKIFAELEFGVVKPDTKKKFISILKRVTEHNKCDGAIMGCTELPLIIEAQDINGAYLDTTDIHIRAIVARCNES